MHLPFTRSAAELLEAVERELGHAASAGRPFDLLTFAGASNVSGEVLPLDELVRLAHETETATFVDAAQLAPHRAIDLEASDADFVAFSGHKVYAPFGSGALIARTERLRDGSPLLRGGGAVRLVSLDDVAWSDPPHRFEAGTPNTVGAIALGAACHALTEYGMEHIAARERELAERLWEGLEQVAGLSPLRMWEDTDDRVGVATFTLEGVEAHELSGRLAQEWGIAVRSGAFCAHPLVAHLLGVPDSEVRSAFERLERGEDVHVPGAVRASIGLGVTEADIDALLNALGTATL